jgi:hypothetical protein
MIITGDVRDILYSFPSLGSDQSKNYNYLITSKIILDDVIFWLLEASVCGQNWQFKKNRLEKDKEIKKESHPKETF